MQTYDVNGIEFEKRSSGYFCNGIYLWDINYIFEDTLTLMNDGSPARLRILLGSDIFVRLKYRVLEKHDDNPNTCCTKCDRITKKKHWRDDDYALCNRCALKLKS